jgi:hypothetical protein
MKKMSTNVELHTLCPHPCPHQNHLLSTDTKPESRSSKEAKHPVLHPSTTITTNFNYQIRTDIRNI